MMIGTHEKYSSASAARKSPEVQGVLRRVNGDHPREAEPPSVGAVIGRYRQEELPERYSTRSMYESLIRTHILPRWGHVPLGDVEPLAVEKWLAELPLAPKTRKHIKALMHLLFQSAKRWRWWENENPIDTVRVKGGTRRKKKPRVLSFDEFRAVLSHLREPFCTMALLAGCLGLRICEVCGLQWGDFDFENLTVLISRSIVHGRVGAVKTEYSQDYVPLDPDVAAVLREHKTRCYPTPEGWLFANPKTGRPYLSDQIQKKHLNKAGLRAGIGETLGWHTFRHSYRSWLDATGAPMGVQRELMRHADIKTTMNVYGKAADDRKREANSKVVVMALHPPAEPVLGVNGSSMKTAEAV